MAQLLQSSVAPPAELAPYGLLSLGDPVSEPDERWAGGYSYESVICRTSVVLSDHCDPSKRVVVRSGSTVCDENVQRGVVVEVQDSRSTFGFSDAERELLALDQMDICTQKALEYELWTGALAAAAGYAENKRLAAASATDVTPTPGTPVKIKYGLALLEQALANTGCGARGVIHATRAVASALGATAADKRLETPMGNYVVAGVGYPGTGPTGVMPPAGVWMYATGAVQYRLGEPFLPAEEVRQRVDTATNTLTTRALRAAAVDFDGCSHYGVLVDLSLDYT